MLFVLEHMAVIHKNTRLMEKNFDDNFFTIGNKDGVFESALFWRWGSSVSGNNLELGAVNVERMPGSMCVSVKVADHPELRFI